MANLHTSFASWAGWGGYSKLINGREWLPEAPLYADVRDYCSHVNLHCKDGTSVFLSSMTPSFHPKLPMLRSYVVKLVLYGTCSSSKEKQLRRKRQQKEYNSTLSTFILGLHVIFVWLQYRHPSNQYKMRLWLKVQARIWPVTRLESLHPPLLGSKRAVVNAHQEMFWGWSIFTEIKVESTDVKQAIGVAISQWLHSSMCIVSEGNNNHKNIYIETCIKFTSF